MKNLSVVVCTFILMFMITQVEAQSRKRSSAGNKKQGSKKVVHKTRRQPVTKQKVVRVRTKRTQVVHYNYRHLPRRGAVVTTVHRNALNIRFGGVGYRFHSGVWYKPVGTRWMVVRPSHGLRIRVLPQGCRRVVVGSVVYHYYYGTYYRQQQQEYEVVEAPMGAEIRSLPDGYNEIVVNDVDYYELDNNYYMPSLNEEGEEILVVVDNPMR